MKHYLVPNYGSYCFWKPENTSGEYSIEDKQGTVAFYKDSKLHNKNRSNNNI